MSQSNECLVGNCDTLELLQGQLLSLQQEHQEREVQLRERIKELDCLYRLTKLIEENEDSLDQILLGAVELLPVSWQHPVITCARIRFREQTFQSNNFKATQWQQKAPLIVSGLKEGTVEVYYLKKMPRLDEGPFLKEERLLIDAVSNHIAKAAERINTLRQLQVERQALQDANAALHDSLVQSQRDKRKFAASIQGKIDKIISPILYALQKEMKTSQLEYLELLKKYLEDITSPFVEKSGLFMSKLSPVEFQIGNMIKYGLSTKEIARIRGISPATVNRHRESIRRKLDLTNRKVNLTSYLNNIVDESRQD
ncbi:MAG: helix-turn-helix transcriptional regulator [Desulfuromonas sp.]|nr:MAG: helix-turn-helix transcriptional regulator [Desulfuromonas sp.]